MNNSTWKSDPRLHSMDAAKIALLASFADELANTPENERMRAFLNLNQKMQKESISFSADEKELLFDVLCESLSPAGASESRNDPPPRRAAEVTSEQKRLGRHVI